MEEQLDTHESLETLPVDPVEMEPQAETELLKQSTFKSTLKTIWKVILFLLLVIVFFVIGLIIGYAVIGKGNFWEVLSQDTWRRIFELVNAR